MNLRSRRAVASLAALGALTSAACVKPGDPGVSIANLKADIVFGVREPAPPAAPANVAFTQPEVFVEEELPIEEKVLELPDITPIPSAPPQAANACPAAALTAFPKKTAEVAVQGTPKPGVYKFKRSVALTDVAGQTTTSTGFEQRVVRRVTPTPNKPYEFTYEVVQPNYFGAGGFTVTRYRVNSNPAVIQNVNEPPQTIGVVTVPGVELTLTPPQDEPGIFVDSIEVQDDKGSAVSSFTPARGVKYLPLDEGILKAGQTWSSLGIDVSSGQVLIHQGTVVRKTRVDACGEIVEGWLVEATQQFSSDLVERKFFYNIATQEGALFIAETTQFEQPEGGQVALDLSLAALEPAPLPPNLQ